jgi:hypothetical protein
MTNRILALSIPAAIFAAVVVAIGVALVEPGLPQAAQNELDRYVAYRQGLTGVAPSIGQITPSSRPSRFTTDWSKVSYGDSPYYRTTNHYQLSAAPTLAASGANRIHFFSESGRPLPFPPERLWCVLLDPGDLEARRVVFVALHEDLYNADWIVHEGPAGVSGIELDASLDSLGCAIE